MKTMSKFVIIAKELFDSVSARIDEPLRMSIWEDLDCGEEGVAVMRTLEWAVETQTPIDESLWSALSEFNASANGIFSQDIRDLLSTVAHAA